VADVPATSQRLEQVRRPRQTDRQTDRHTHRVSWAIACLLDLVAPPRLACVSQDTRAAQEQELESLREQLASVNHNIEEVEADMKTLGINLVQVRGLERDLGWTRSELGP
jgi:hypothetical protein